MGERRAVTKAIATRYARSSRAAKKTILDELCATTGWHRDHARKALRRGLVLQVARPRTPRPPLYGEAVIEALRFCWAVQGTPCGRLLAAALPEGKAIGISGPPDPAFARKAGLSPVLRLAITALSSKIRRQARKLGVSYEFLFIRASGEQLRKISALVDDGVLRPIVGKVFTFDQTPEALQSLSAGGIRGKAVLTVNN